MDAFPKEEGTKEEILKKIAWFAQKNYEKKSNYNSSEIDQLRKILDRHAELELELKKVEAEQRRTELELKKVEAQERQAEAERQECQAEAERQDKLELKS